MKILIDNGHGAETPGKCSPDRRLLEWRYTRQIARAVVNALKTKGLDAELLVPEDRDIPLSTRADRVNSLCSRLGSRNVLLVSIHVNAAGNDGRWKDARGWSGWVCAHASERTRRFAALLYDRAAAKGLQGNRAVPDCKYWTANFAILRNTRCPAVLTENLFQDNLEDVDLLLSAEGRKKIVDLHVEAISEYAANRENVAKPSTVGKFAAAGKKALRALVWIAVAASMLFVGGCIKKVYVPLESYSVMTDTLWRSLSHCDTLRERDSVYIFQRGDTLREFRLRERLRYRDRVDTLYRTRCDTVIVDRPVTVSAQSKPSPIERVGRSVKGFIWGLLLAAAAFATWLVKKKFWSKN